MLKKNRCSENDLANFYYSCVLFKKYYQYNLWFGTFGEYDNIKYCKKYLQQSIYRWIHIFLLQRFNLFFIIFLYKSPCFIKFIESRFLKYLDYHFLLLFYNNCFTFDLKGKQKIKIFAEFYFQNFLKKRFKKDLLILVPNAINEITLNVLTKHLTNRLKDIQIYMEWLRLNEKILFKLVSIKNKKEVYFIGFIYFNYLVKKGYYGSHFNNLGNSYSLKFYCPFISLKLIHKSMLECLKFKENETLKFNLKPSKVSKPKMEKTFIGFSRKTLEGSNRDIQHLVESVEILGAFNSQEKSIGFYKNFNIIFKDSYSQKHLLFIKPFKNNFFKSKINKKVLSKTIKKRFIIKYKSSFIKNSKMFNNISYNYNSCLLYKKVL